MQVEEQSDLFINLFLEIITHIHVLEHLFSVVTISLSWVPGGGACGFNHLKCMIFQVVAVCLVNWVGRGEDLGMTLECYHVL